MRQAADALLNQGLIDQSVLIDELP
jgi:hypothetical protein